MVSSDFLGLRVIVVRSQNAKGETKRRVVSEKGCEFGQKKDIIIEIAFRLGFRSDSGRNLSGFKLPENFILNVGSVGEEVDMAGLVNVKLRTPLLCGQEAALYSSHIASKSVFIDVCNPNFL